MACVSRSYADFDRCSFCLLNEPCPRRPGGPLDMDAAVAGTIVSRGLPMYDGLRSFHMTRVSE